MSRTQIKAIKFGAWFGIFLCLAGLALAFALFGMVVPALGVWFLSFAPALWAGLILDELE